MSKSTSERRKLAGFQDFMPEKMMARDLIIGKIKAAYALFGFLPQETPVLEYADLLLGKYGDNDKLVYQFRDNGDRHVAMRYDLTVPLSRVIQMYANDIVFPYRRYQVGMVWRADKPGKGRFREFMQVDADIVGDGSVLADIEIISLTLQIMKTLGIDATVRLNDRRVLDGLAEICKIPAEMSPVLFRTIDKYDKIGAKGVMGELNKTPFPDGTLAIVERYLSITGLNDDVLQELQSLLGTSSSFQAGFSSLYAINDALKSSGGEQSMAFRIDPSIARGLDYYTGLIFETTFNSDPEFGSVCSGGRYDQLIKGVDGKPLPTIGVSIGLDRLFAAMESIDLIPRIKTTTQAFIVNFGNEYLGEYLRLATELRANGISVEISSDASKLKKQFRCADTKGIPMVIVMGPDELSQGNVVVKNMSKGLQETVERKDISSRFPLIF